MEKRENIAVLKRISLSYMMVERKKTNVSRGKKMIAKKRNKMVTSSLSELCQKKIMDGRPPTGFFIVYG